MAILFAVSVFAFTVVVSQDLPSSWIPIETSGLKVLTTQFTFTGRVQRRLINDSLWLPLTNKTPIFEGDTLFVESGGKLELAVDPGTKLEIPENTMVRLQIFDGRLLIVLKKGDMKVMGSTEVNVQVGETRKSEPIKEGKIAVRPANPTQGEGQNPTDQPKLEVLENEDLRPEDITLKKLPYPENKTVFLHFGRGKIHLIPKKQCSRKCRFVVRQGTEVIIEREFSTEFVPQAKIEIGISSNGLWSWSLQDKEDLEGTFEIAPMTSENFQRAVKDQLNVEVLEN